MIDHKIFISLVASLPEDYILQVLQDFLNKYKASKSSGKCREDFDLALLMAFTKFFVLSKGFTLQQALEAIDRADLFVKMYNAKDQN